MLTEKRLNIIARYNEDVLWSRHIIGKLIIYNKGESDCYSGGSMDKSDIEVRKIPNVGYDTETFFRAIYENYDDLYKYDSVAFMQGEPFSHCKYLFEKLDHNLKGEFDMLATWTGMHPIPNDDLIFGRHKHNIDKLMFNRYKKIESLENFEEEYIKHLSINHIYMLELLDIDYKTINHVHWACGSQYLVSTKLLLNKSKSWWKSSWEIVYYLYDQLAQGKTHLGTSAIERLWPIIWKHSDKIGDWCF